MALTVVAFVSLAGWLGVLLGTACAWDLRPIAEDEPAPPDPTSWPSVTVLVPARNEAEQLPRTLPALLAQDYPGAWHLVVVDDRSTDGTPVAARDAGVEPVPGTELPDGWVGKVWALEQAAGASGSPDYLLLTDADIRHAPRSLRRLVAESEAAGLALNSRMARLRCQAPAERLLIPPFVFFFNLLYPMRRVNRRPAAAGGCVLVRREALERAGGFAAIRDRVIDDVSLARAIRPHGSIRLSVSRSDVVSLREHDLGGIWRMVRRTAFTELRHSWTLLALTIALLLVLFAAPPALTVVGFATGNTLAGGAAAAAWALMTALYLPTIHFFRLSPAWTLTLPLAGCLYGAMTVDSAVRGRRGAW
ncbi:MAG TPA: glycosyltransferase [Gaiellaceae bacterium]|nr:glycosyltransferase [Gaiellaceae bacterium]